VRGPPASAIAPEYVLRHKALVAGAQPSCWFWWRGNNQHLAGGESAPGRSTSQTAVSHRPGVNDFLQNDLLAQASAATQSGPSAKPDPDLKVRTALDRAAERIEGKFAKQPEVEAAIRDTIGRTYTDLG